MRIIRLTKVVLICLVSVLVVACTNRVQTKIPPLKEVIATFNGEAITVRDILSQYTWTEENVHMYLKEEVIIAEAKADGIIISPAYLQELKQDWSPNIELVGMESMTLEGSQALGITEEEYFNQWVDQYLERNEYVQVYLTEKIEEPHEERTAEAIEEWGQQVAAYINTAYEQAIENKHLIIHQNRSWDKPSEN